MCTATTSILWADQAEDEAAIRKNVAAYVTAYNKHDAKTLATFWSPDAVYVNPETGEEAVGHDAIGDQFTDVLANLGDAQLAVDVKSIVFLSPTVAVERGTARREETRERGEELGLHCRAREARRKVAVGSCERGRFARRVLKLRAAEGPGMDDRHLD